MGRVAIGRASGVKPSQMFSMRVVSDFIPNRSRLWITTTVTSDWASKTTGGYATGDAKKRWKAMVRKEGEKGS